MTTTTHLSSGRINVAKFRDDARHELSQILSHIYGSKTIAWEKSLINPINLVVEHSLLKSHDVTRMVNLIDDEAAASGVLPTITTDNVIFIIRGRLSSIEKMCQSVKQALSTDPSTGVKFFAIMVPRGRLVCESILSDLGILGNFEPLDQHIIELPIIFPLDSDLLSLEDSDAFRSHLVDRDSSIALNAGIALTRVQTFFGVIPNVKGVGRLSHRVCELMKRLRTEEEGNSYQSHSGKTSQIDSVILFDRSLDMVTPLVTQHNYEGLIDELFSIRCARAKFPEANFVRIDDPTDKTTGSPVKSASSSSHPADTKELPLASAEELFTKIRDRHFESIKPILQKTSKKLSAMKTDTNNVKSVAELKQIMVSLGFFFKAKSSVSNHIAVAEVIKSKIETKEFYDQTLFEADLLNLRNYDPLLLEEMMYQSVVDNGPDMVKVLRLLSLLCQTKGVKKSQLDNYRKEFISSYGFKMFPSLMQMEAVGLLKSANSYLPTATGSQTPFTLFKRYLNLTDPKFEDKFNPEAPGNIYHPYNGYVPISVKLIEILSRSEDTINLPDMLKSLVQVVIDEKQSPKIPSSTPTITISKTGQQESKVVLVVFLGGCTFAEVSALRLLSQQEDMNVDFVVLTTNVTSGRHFLSQFICK